MCGEKTKINMVVRKDRYLANNLAIYLPFLCLRFAIVATEFTHPPVTGGRLHLGAKREGKKKGGQNGAM